MTTNEAVEIILVEDNMDDAALAIRTLKKQNLANKLVHLKDGAEALDFMFGTGAYEGRNITNTPKVVLLDLKMPKVNGIEVLQKLKSDERTKHIPVVVLTSSAEDPDIRTCYQLGVNSYIVKPLGFDAFTNKITDLGMYWLVMNEVPRD
ncbi:MAG TPA: response regulator [Bacteroidia bacterium]|jgi:two-component system response regulator|nr:response regulator [Bacteroidia bacterium]